MGGDAAGQGSIIVDIEFEKVEERIVYGLECTVYVCRYKSEKFAKLLRYWKGAYLSRRQNKAPKALRFRCMS